MTPPHETRALPSVLSIVMLDGEVVAYRIEQRHDGRIYAIGPCPGCYARARMGAMPADAVIAAERPFPLDEPRELAAIMRGQPLTQLQAVKHGGCFTGRVVRNTWEACK